MSDDLLCPIESFSFKETTKISSYGLESECIDFKCKIKFSIKDDNKFTFIFEINAKGNTEFKS